jgi:hypothetical protein
MQHINQPGVVCDPVITLRREAGGRVRAEAKPYPGARPEVWEGTSESVAIHWAGNSARELSPNSVLCVEWPSDSVAHESRRMTPMCELELFWRHMRASDNPVSNVCASTRDRTTLDIDSVDGWGQ